MLGENSAIGMFSLDNPFENAIANRVLVLFKYHLHTEANRGSNI